jgi:RNA polymerase sigma factor (sigma-70 family)
VRPGAEVHGLAAGRRCARLVPEDRPQRVLRLVGRNRPAEILHDENETVDAAVDIAAVTPEQAAMRKAELRTLADAVASLPLQYREVLILRELEELSYKEIARIANIPIGTVMSRLARARDLLQRSPLLYAIGGQVTRSIR